TFFQARPSNPGETAGTGLSSILLEAFGAKVSRASFLGTNVARPLTAGAACATSSGYSTILDSRYMRRYPSSPYTSSYSFGPGGISTAIKALIGANVALFLVQFFAPAVTDVLGLRPIFVVRYFWV